MTRPKVQFRFDGRSLMPIEKLREIGDLSEIRVGNRVIIIPKNSPLIMHVDAQRLNRFPVTTRTEFPKP